MDLQKWMSVRTNYEAYLEWRNNPVTMAVIEGLRSASGINKLSMPTGEEALQQLGFIAGREAIFTSMLSLDEVFVPTESGEDIKTEQVQYLMRVEGYSKKDAERIVKQGENDA